VDTVAIGGINTRNVQRVIYQSAALTKNLDGVAIVSAIMAAEDPESAAKELKGLITARPTFVVDALAPRKNEEELLLARIPEVVQRVATTHPLVHNMINFVVVNFVANMALAAYAFLYSPLTECTDYI
jgi:thiamine-phosphate diphosphorylase/hydroxyethylthiazole kinase